MQSPFPGMDPYLEQHWGDVHHSLVTFAQGSLNEQLPADLRARVEERVLWELPSHDDHVEPETQGFIEILQVRPDRRLITVIECPQSIEQICRAGTGFVSREAMRPGGCRCQPCGN